MFSCSCLGEMLHLLWLQLCDSLGHTFSGDVFLSLLLLLEHLDWDQVEGRSEGI